MYRILGNDGILNAFREAALSGKHSHAYIIEGAEGSGKLTLARAISSMLTCPHPETDTRSDCPSCRRALEGIHQDIKEIRCEEGASVIKIETVRDMIADAHIKPAESPRKVFIVDSAHKTKPETQNALLQIFEEPPKNVVIFLLVPNRNLLLPTLKSRAVALKTEKFSRDFIKEELLKRYPDKSGLAENAALIADGALGRGIAFMESEEERAAVESVKEYFSCLSERAAYARLSSIMASSVGTDRRVLFSVMSYFLIAIRDIMTCKEGYTEKMLFFYSPDTPLAVANKTDRQKLLSAYDTACRIIRDADKINVPLALANISLELSDDL